MSEPEVRRPNVVLIMTDQQRADHLGCCGAPIRTPHLDGLAARSRVFERAYVSNPICQPSRSSILTGRVPSAHGSRHNGIALDPRAATFVRQLRLAGYRTGLIGKLHVQNMGDHPELVPLLVDPNPPTDALSFEPAGWDTWELESRYDDPQADHVVPEDFYGFDHVEFAINHSDVVGGHYRLWLREQGVDPAKIQGEANSVTVSAEWSQVRQPGIPVELYPTTWIADRAESFIRTQAHASAPFFLQVSFPDPHHPFTPPGDYAQLYNPADMAIPDSFGDTHATSLPHIRQLIEARGSQSFPLAPWAPTEQQLRTALAAEFGMITLIDDAVGRVLGVLDDTGVRDDTIVVFTSDHGDMFGDHGLLLKGALHYRAMLQVPLFIAVPGITPGATSSLVSTLDLAATICSLTDTDSFSGDQGHDLSSILTDPTATVRDGVLVEEEQLFTTVTTGRPLKMRTLITDEARISRYYGTDAGELFDLGNDPDEMHNLAPAASTAGTPVANELWSSMNNQLLQAMFEHVDEPRRATHLA
jgi:arylsulfatase A-like enzyme